MYTNVSKRGSKILYRGIENGVRVTKKVDFYPTLWISGKMKDAGEPWKTIYKQDVAEIQPGNLYECKQFIEQYKDVHNFDVYEPPGYEYQYITETHPPDISYNFKDILIYSLDIETKVPDLGGFASAQTAYEEITLITLKDLQKNTLITWGQLVVDSVPEHVSYRFFEDEIDMLKDFISWWQMNYPDIITGWNSNTFDVTYIYNRLKLVLSEKMADQLSPFGVVQYREIKTFNNNKEEKTYRAAIVGIALLDYLELYKKFGARSVKESYKLDAIALEELKEQKLKNPYNTFREFYLENPTLFLVYNVKDVELVDRLEKKMKLLELALTIAYTCKINYEDVYGPVKMWDIIIYNYLNSKRMVVPRHRRNVAQPFEGAYVKDPLVGKHKWCCSYDYDSLYPHLMMLCNMSPETITNTHKSVSVDQLVNEELDLSFLKEQNLAMAANGWCFDRTEKGMLPSLVEMFYNKRVVYKKEMLKQKQELEDIDNEIKRRSCV
jgi:DNA polymerase elongation subunit (family B)